MRLFVSEFICGGGSQESPEESSLTREGLSMLRAVLEDCSRIPGLSVATTWDTRLGEHSFCGVDVHPVSGPDEEADRFRELAVTCDATWLIAPEFDCILENRARIVEQVGGRLVSPSADAIALCADKFRLAGVLDAWGIETIPTGLIDPGVETGESLPFPIVIKPRDGAGSQETYLVRSGDEWKKLRPAFGEGRLEVNAIWQPYIPGRAVSMAVILTPNRQSPDSLPVCDQILSTDGRFSYLGGRVPGHVKDPYRIHQCAVQACRLIPGLAGYVGVDLIEPEENPERPVVVEINPRVTTSYLGYAAFAALTEENLAMRILFPEQWRCHRVIVDFIEDTVNFSPDGKTWLS